MTVDGTESEPGNISDPITVASKKIDLTIPISGTYNVASRKIYRTVTLGTVYKLLATVADDTTTTYQDNIADGALGANIVSTSVLAVVPLTYHFSVLIPGVIAKARKVKGDTRDWEGEFQKGLAYMVNREIQRRSVVKRLPRVVPGRMW